MAFCQNCGREVPAGSSFCTSCGTRVNEAPQGNANPGYQAPPTYSAPAYTAPPVYAAPVTTSSWDGGVGETIGTSIIASLIMSVSCGIATPWAVCYLWKFIIGHTIIDGKRLKFDGDGGALFGEWIIWFLLTLVTCGIYSFWVTPKMYNWLAKHTHFE